jgi:hypothetical protein
LNKTEGNRRRFDRNQNNKSLGESRNCQPQQLSMHPVPQQRKNAPNRITDRRRHNDEPNRSAQAECFDDIDRFDEVQPEDEIDERLRPPGRDNNRPQKVISAEQSAEHETRCIGADFACHDTPPTIHFKMGAVCFFDLPQSLARTSQMKTPAEWAGVRCK